MTPTPGPAHSGALRRFGALSFFYFAAIGLFNPYAPLWFQSLGFSTLAIGFIASLQAWTRVFVPYGWAWMGDHSGRRVELIRLSALGCFLAALGLLWARPFADVAFMTVLLFAANGGVVPLYESTLAHLLSTGSGGMDSARYGRVRVWGSIGFIVVVTLAGVALERTGIGAFPWFVAGMNAALLVVALRLPTLREKVQAEASGESVLGTLKQPLVRWFFASVFFTVLAHTSLYAFFSLYLDALGYPKSAVGALWAVSVGVEIAFFWYQGRWFSRLAPLVWLQVVALVVVLRFTATAVAGTVLVVLVLAQLSHAISFAAHHAACIALVHRWFPGRLRGRGQALYTTLGYGLSGVLGGVGGGWLIGKAGYEAVFWASTVAGLAAWLCARRCALLEAAAGPASA